MDLVLFRSPSYEFLVEKLNFCRKIRTLQFLADELAKRGWEA